MNYLIFSFLLLFTACKEDPTSIDPPTIPENVWDLHWATRMDESQEIIGSDNVHIYKDWYLKGGADDAPPTILAFNKHTGKKEWEFVHEGNLKRDILYSAIQENIYVAITRTGALGIDLETKSSLWEIEFSAQNLVHRKGIVFNGDYFYHPVSWNFGNANRVDHMLQIDYKTGAMNMIASIGTIDNWNPNFSPPTFWENPENGETLMIFNNGQSNPSESPQESPQDLVAYNLNSQSIAWKAEKFCAVPTNLLISPVTYKNDIITGGDWSMYSFNAATGTLNWKKEFPQINPVGIWNKTNHLVVGDQLFLNPDGTEVICLNAATGEVIWTNEDGGGNCTDQMLYYQDLLIFTSWGYGSVMVLDAKTGKTIHREHRFDDSQFNNDIAYDEELDMFFTSTYKHAIGFKINKP